MLIARASKHFVKLVLADSLTVEAADVLADSDALVDALFVTHLYLRILTRSLRLCDARRLRILTHWLKLCDALVR